MTAPPPKHYPDVAPQADYPRLEEQVLAYWKERGTFQRSIDQRPAGEHGPRFRRRPPLRQRPPALRPPAYGLREGRRAALLPDARPPRRPPFRLGLPRVAGGDGGREGAEGLGPRGDHRVRDRQIQRR